MVVIGLGELSALVAALMWALNGIAVRLLSSRLSATAINAARSTVAAVLLLALLPLAGSPFDVPVTAYLLLLGAVCLGPGLGDTLFFESIRLLGVSRAVPLSSTYPLFATLLSVLILSEPLRLVSALGVVAVVAGVYLVAQPGRLVSPWELMHGRSAKGVAIGLTAAFVSAVATIMTRPALEHIDIVLANAVRMPMTAGLMWLVAWRRGSLPSPKVLSRRQVGGLLLVGALAAASSLAFLGGLQLVGAAKAATLVSTSPLFAVPLAAALLREAIGPLVLAGTLLTVGGVWLLLAGG